MRAPEAKPRPARTYYEAPRTYEIADPGFSKLCARQMAMCLDGASPKQVIEAIEPAFESLTPRGQRELKAHLADLYRFGEHWPKRYDKPTGAWVMPDGRLVSMTSP